MKGAQGLKEIANSLAKALTIKLSQSPAGASEIIKITDLLFASTGVIGEDFPRLKFLGKQNSSGIPTTAIYLQSSIAILFILSSTFESILVFAGFTMALNTFATVLGLFVTRWKKPDIERPYKAFLYPVTPVVFLLLTGWTLSFTLIERPVEGLFSLGVIASGLVFYFITSRTSVS